MAEVVPHLTNAPQQDEHERNLVTAQLVKKKKHTQNPRNKNTAIERDPGSRFRRKLLWCGRCWEKVPEVGKKDPIGWKVNLTVQGELSGPLRFAKEYELGPTLAKGTGSVFVFVF